MFEIPKQCPYCASNEIKVTNWYVGIGKPSEHIEYACFCNNCGAQGPNDLGTSGAIKAWNMRREPQKG